MKYIGKRGLVAHDTRARVLSEHCRQHKGCFVSINRGSQVQREPWNRYDPRGDASAEDKKDISGCSQSRSCVSYPGCISG